MAVKSIYLCKNEFIKLFNCYTYDPIIIYCQTIQLG